MRAFLVLFTLGKLALAVAPDQKTLPIGLAPEERGMRVQSRRATEAPQGEIRSLAEWEEAEAVMTLWSNASLLKALSDHGAVKLIADTDSDVGYWKNFLAKNDINATPFSYLIVPTDSMWVRDYGPWFILDGKRQFGIVDNTYNRPRPQDDVFPEFLAKKLALPFYHTGLTHTGGNYYNDGWSSAFSSTLVYSENKKLAKAGVDERMKSYLGIKRYTTSPLGVQSTIEHMDTFGKLVSPDTWVFADFPEGSRYKADADAMVEKLNAMKSAFGTPYKIHRLKMQGSGENYRAYINSFISNKVIYYPTYGNDEGDKYAGQVYQRALPGYEVVGVDAMGTTWGDSVHCRNRNLLAKNAVFLFPEVKSLGDSYGPFEVEVEAIPSPGATFAEEPMLHWSWNGTEMTPVSFKASDKPNYYTAMLPAQSKEGTLSLYVAARDSAGKMKTSPRAAPAQQIVVNVPATP